MTGIVACALDMPLLAEAAGARGLVLMPVARNRLGAALAGSDAAAVLVGCTSGEDRAQVGEVRAHGWDGAVMLVLAEGSSGHVASALDAGADDAVALPASAGEIAARLAARIRHRTAPAAVALGELRIDRVERRVTRAGRPIDLLPREYALLLHLARHAGQCVSRAGLLEAVWGLGFDPGTNVVEVHVSRLRAKLDQGFAAPMLCTERGRGYRLEIG